MPYSDWAAAGVPLSLNSDGQVCAEHLPCQTQGAHHSQASGTSFFLNYLIENRYQFHSLDFAYSINQSIK